MITVLRSSTDFIFLSILTDFNSVIILLTVKTLNKFVIIMIELIILELAMKEQFIINQQINLC